MYTEATAAGAVPGCLITCYLYRVGYDVPQTQFIRSYQPEQSYFVQISLTYACLTDANKEYLIEATQMRFFKSILLNIMSHALMPRFQRIIYFY